jgi:hypothetical protein
MPVSERFAVEELRPGQTYLTFPLWDRDLTEIGLLATEVISQ